MTGIETAARTASAIGGLASNFMLDMATYAKGGELGFAGMDFYVAGRAGVLGDVDADVVSAALVFFNPATVRSGWEASGSVMPRVAAASAFIECGYLWAQTHLDDSVDWNRLGDLASVVAEAGPMPCAPLFAGWRSVPSPTRDDPKARALHQLNLLRELRMAQHSVAVVAAGIRPYDAMVVRSPHMLAIFGWAAPDPEVDIEPLRVQWEAAEANTDRLFGAVLDSLDDAEQDEFADMLTAATAAVT